MEVIDILIVVVVPFIIGVMVGMYFEKKIKEWINKNIKKK